MKKSKRKQDWQDPLFNTAITMDEVNRLAAGIQVGDKIKWEVLYGDLTIQKVTVKGR